jgi:hypothetical protein
MTTAPFFRLIVTAFIALALPAPGHAHPRKEAETDVTFNEHSGLVEILHRFQVHDAEAALQKAEGSGLNLLEDAQAQSLFGAYIEDRFSITHNGKPIELALVGGEFDNGMLWIYQESAPLPEDGLYVLRDTALMDAIPQQLNIVNIRLYDGVQSFILSRNSPWVTFRLDGKSPFAD